MARFLTRQQLYRVLQRELPEGVYPDGPPTAFFSTADMDSIADVACTGYANLRRIYENEFPQSADERIDAWTEKVGLSNAFEPGTTLQQKRDRVISKLRKQPEITQWELLRLVASYLPDGKYVQIRENNCPSPLTLEEIYGEDPGYDYSFDDLNVSPADWCSIASTQGWKLGVDELGVSTELSNYGYLQVLIPQIKAFGYQIRIFDYEVTGLNLSQMIKAIGEAEPARSLPFLKQNQDLNDFGLINTVTDVDQFSGVDCITQDPTSSTGYSGRTT